VGKNRKPYKEGRVIEGNSRCRNISRYRTPRASNGRCALRWCSILDPRERSTHDPRDSCRGNFVAAGMTDMDGTSSRRSNSDDCYQDKAQVYYGFPLFIVIQSVTSDFGSL
jgi:hypothetical protein